VSCWRGGSVASFLRDMIGYAAQRLIELETESLCGAGHGERSTDRCNQRNGYRERDWETRAGTVELRIRHRRYGLTAKMGRGGQWITGLPPSGAQRLRPWSVSLVLSCQSCHAGRAGA
jgi:hypothetical protein